MTEFSDVERYLDSEEKRHYTRGSDINVLSVTTILDEKNNGEEPYGIKKWKENNDGRGDNADWRDILEYKQNRGTLAHYAALSDLEEHHPHGDRLWSSDEESSLDEVMERAYDTGFMYSVMKDRGWVEDQKAYREYLQREDTTVDDILYNDLEFFKDGFSDIMGEKGVGEGNIEAVEHMFALPENEESGHKGFGGQADMIYEDPETGEHVVVDLKTSKQIYQKHKYQVAAYAQAAMESPEMNGDYIDRAEVWRIHPDSEDVEVFELEEHKEYWEEFADLTREAYK